MWKAILAKICPEPPQASLALKGLEPRVRVLDLKDRVRCRECGKRGRAAVSVKWGKSAA